jgi:hypothetical protein
MADEEESVGVDLVAQLKQVSEVYGERYREIFDEKLEK